MDPEIGSDHEEAFVPLVGEEGRIAIDRDELAGAAELLGPGARPSDGRQPSGREVGHDHTILESVSQEQATVGKFARPGDLTERGGKDLPWAGKDDDRCRRLDQDEEGEDHQGLS